MTAPLVIIHGWTYTIKPWDKTVTILKEMGVEVHQLRVPGLTQPSDAVWTIDAYVAWLDQELQAIPNPIVLGHSNGGRIAMHYLAQHPNRFKKLILLNSAGVTISSTSRSLKKTAVKASAKVLKPLKYIPGVRRVVYRALGSDYGRAPKNMQATLHNMLEADKGFSPRMITSPTVMLWGESDNVTPLAMGKKIADELPTATLHTFPGWGHAPYLTHPEQVADAIMAAMQESA